MKIGEETEQIEYKRSTAEIDDAMDSIVAILNKHGSGELYFGVRNDGTVIGMDISDKSMRDVSQAIRNHITPIIYPEIGKMEYEGKQVIYVRFQGNQQPYLSHNKPRIRVADEDLIMDQKTYATMLKNREGASLAWERQVSKYTVEDINLEVFNDYLKRARQANRISLKDTDVSSVLNALELSSGVQLLNAAAALFCEKGINELQMAKFRTDERLTFNDIRRETGSIFHLAEVAEKYIIDAMDWRVEFDGSLHRKEIPEIPLKAIREALFNAFGHRLIESGQSVEIAIFKKRIEIFSPGVYASDIEPEEYIRGSERAERRNPLIARTLYYSEDMETFATGFKRIKEECEENCCEVGYEKKKNGFVIIFARRGYPLPESAVRISEKNAQADRVEQSCSSVLDGKNTLASEKNDLRFEKTTQGIGKITPGRGKITLGLEKNTLGSGKITLASEKNTLGIQDYDFSDFSNITAHKRKLLSSILAFCSEPRSLLEVAHYLGYKGKKTARKYLNMLTEHGYLAMTIPEIPSSMHQKYITIRYPE